MNSASRRRSRVLNEDEDDESVSRQSTPASTAPYDRKRARTTAEKKRDADDDTDHNDDDNNTASDQTESANRYRPSSQFESKPAIPNKMPTTKPQHQPGAIVRVKLQNFVTYTSVEFFPGPNLNMVIGPNGTGKSTLVCAICLGLGWGTQYLGRAKDAAEYVKHGCREATIEIELQRAQKGPNQSRVNPVITRTIKREGNKSTYTLNGVSATAKAVLELARSFDIQIDNLCQFLPQDKVVEFAQMTPIEILHSTQRAAAPPHMLQWHKDLIELRKAQTETNNNQKADRETLANYENRQEMQRTEVERLKERAIAQKRLQCLERCRPAPMYAEAKIRRNEAKAKHRAINTELAQLTEQSGPTLEKTNAKRIYEQEVKKHKELREKDVRLGEKECDRLLRTIENHETIMTECDQVAAADKKSVQPIRQDISRSRVKIASLSKQKEQAPEAFDSRAMNQGIKEHVNRARDIENQIEEVRNKAIELRARGRNRYDRGKELARELQLLNTAIGQQEDLLKKRSNDSYRAWEWIKENRSLFQKDVFGPPMVECTMKDPAMATQVEALLQQNDFRIFTVQCKADFQLLQKELTEKQRLHDVSFRTCPIESLDGFRSPLSPDQMQQLGLKGWAIDYLAGPASVLAMLCQEKFLHQCAITDSDITQAQHDQLSILPAVKGYVTKAKSYQFIRRAEYGAAGISAREKTLQRAEVWTDQPVDSGRKQQIEAERRECLNDYNEMKTVIPQLGQENETLTATLEKINEQLQRLKDEKDERQRALVRYNGLDAQIAQEQERVVKCQATLESTASRLKEHTKKKDAAMFAKAEAVLSYCEAVRTLQEKTKALIEIEVFHIEARNDYEVLRMRNEDIVKSLERKRQEAEEAAASVATESENAKKLLAEVQKLSDEGLALEQEHNDRSLTEALEHFAGSEALTLADLEDMIKVEQAKLQLTEGGDVNTIREFEERARKIAQLRKRLSSTEARQQDFLHSIREVREKWEGPLDELVSRISDAFGDSFARIGCAGQVVVYKASSDDPADCTDELGGSNNGLDFANWAIHISVRFRENESLSLLDSHRQSGGERAVSTIFYLMALQSLSRAPFRVVDEINQGMDPRNERMVHGRMVDLADASQQGEGQGSQYFLITPKLLSGLKYSAGMTVLCIVSGENMPSAADQKVKDQSGNWITNHGKKIDFAEFIRIAHTLRQQGPKDSGGEHHYNENDALSHWRQPSQRRSTTVDV